MYKSLGDPKVASALKSSQMLLGTKGSHLLFGQLVKFTPLKSPQAAYGQLYSKEYLPTRRLPLWEGVCIGHVSGGCDGEPWLL